MLSPLSPHGRPAANAALSEIGTPAFPEVAASRAVSIELLPHSMRKVIRQSVSCLGERRFQIRGRLGDHRPTGEETASHEEGQRPEAARRRGPRDPRPRGNAGQHGGLTVAHDETAIGGAKRGFQSTLWTIVLAAKDPAAPDRRQALESLIE